MTIGIAIKSLDSYNQPETSSFKEFPFFSPLSLSRQINGEVTECNDLVGTRHPGRNNRYLSCFCPINRTLSHRALSEVTAKWSWVGGHIQTCSTDRPFLLICIFVFVFAFLCICKCIWTMFDQIYSAGKAFSCSICTCFKGLVEVNMQCCLPFRPLLLVSEFCRSTCAYVYDSIDVFVFLFPKVRTPIKLCSADACSSSHL